MMPAYFKCFRKMCMLLVATLGLAACQHQQLTFTDTAPVTLANYQAPNSALQSLTDALDVAPPTIELPYTLQINGLYWHQWLALDDWQHQRLKLSALIHQQVISNPDILQAALNQRLALLSQSSTYENALCFDATKVRARLHSISIEMHCNASFTEKSTLLGQLLSPEMQLSATQQANLTRQLKLNKHINAFTGSEVNQHYFSKLLGKQHPYQQNTNNADAINQLDSAAINHTLKQVFQYGQWHVFSAKPAHALNTLSSDLDIKPTLTSSEQIDVFGYIAQYHNNEKHLNSEKYRNNEKHRNNQKHEHHNQDKAQSNPTSETAPQLSIGILNADDAPQTQVRYGYLLAAEPLNLNSEQALENRVACEALSAILGRGFSGRLFYDLRETRGLTYGIYGYCHTAPLGQFITFYGSTALTHSGAFIDGITQHIKTLQTQTMAPEELTAVKRHLAGKQIIALDSLSGKESEILTSRLLGQNAAQTNAFYQAIAALSPQDIQILANKYLQKPVIVVRGDQQKITPDLSNKLPQLSIEQLKR
ncbi:M16 family metallopeptidase [Shewanella maritima]|uniref:M16 family metallopeptidase n=1 Tax=Shewanella maritima TaxID=2520507 RepID=UPI003736FB4B